MENQPNITSVENLKVCRRKLARTDLRLQIFRRNSHSMDITPLINFEEDYNIKLKEQVLTFKEKIIDVQTIAKQIFKAETLRRIRIQERDINFHCPDCIHLSEENDDFICKKGIDPAKVQECKLFKREDLNGWLQHVNNKKGRISILKEILEKEEYLFDFALLDK